MQHLDMIKQQTDLIAQGVPVNPETGERDTRAFAELYLKRGKTIVDMLSFGLGDVNAPEIKVLWTTREDIIKNAIDDFTQAIILNPTADTYQRRGNAYLSLWEEAGFAAQFDNFTRAMDDYNFAITLIPKDNRRQIAYGQLRLSSAFLRRANRYKSVSNDSVIAPDSQKLRQNSTSKVYSVLSAENDIGRAMELLQESGQMLREDIHARDEKEYDESYDSQSEEDEKYALSRVLDDLYQACETHAAVAKLKKEYKSAIATCTAAIDWMGQVDKSETGMAPRVEHENTAIMLSKLYMLNRDYDNAIREFTILLDDEPGLKDAETMREEFYKQRAAAYVAKGDMERALSDYKSAYDVPTVVEYYTKAADRNLKAHKYDAGIKDLTEAIIFADEYHGLEIPNLTILQNLYKKRIDAYNTTERWELAYADGVKMYEIRDLIKQLSGK